MSNTPITSLPGYPYFYAIPINGYIRDGPDKRSKRFSKSRLQDRHSLPPQYTPPPAWSPYIIEGLAELDGLNEIPRQIRPDHQRPYDKPLPTRPQTTSPKMSQRRKSHSPSLSTKHSWTAYKPQVSSPLSSSSSADKLQDLATIEEQESNPSIAANSHRAPVAEMERPEEDMSDEERVQVALIESIFLMLHNLQPSYLPQAEKTVSKIMPRPSRKNRLSRQPSVRISPMFAS